MFIIRNSECSAIRRFVMNNSRTGWGEFCSILKKHINSGAWELKQNCFFCIITYRHLPKMFVRRFKKWHFRVRDQFFWRELLNIPKTTTLKIKVSKRRLCENEGKEKTTAPAEDPRYLTLYAQNPKNGQTYYIWPIYGVGALKVKHERHMVRLGI